jgi:primosomal protein N' (replication factor Y)
VPPTRLTPDQEAALEAVEADLAGERFRVHLLAGVTGSGKTEVYLRAIASALEQGRTALLLVPEIGLAPILARAVRGRFGEVAAILHSALRPDERLAEWRRVREGTARVVLGARSAVFAPIRRLGIVVVDEEHEAAYKQEESPRYHGRDLALVRAAREGAVALLGSATPSLESWHRARRGMYRLSLLPRRVGDRPLPQVEIVDMREEFRSTGSTAPLSGRLVEALAGLRARGEQAIVLLNRRGYSSFVLCRECGETVLCPRCELSLTYHRGGERLRCHYCNHTRPRPTRCPGCSSPHLHFGGEGTERAERHLLRHIPDLRVLRMDRDTVRAREGHLRILSRFEAGEAEVLLGTQMVAKGHDFPRVTLVGVLAADAILGRPDFRAAERTFQLITQVAGRAGRGDRPGRVLVQAFRPGHPAIRSALTQDHAGFASKEMRYRRALGYPPCSHLARVLVSDGDLGRARARAREAAEALAAAGEGRLVLLGPAPAPLARLRGRHRIHLLARATARGRLVAALRAMLQTLDPEGGAPRGLIVDVDPLQLQ